MPRGPKGEKRPADVIGNAVHVMRIATGRLTRKCPTLALIMLDAAASKAGKPARKH